MAKEITLKRVATYWPMYFFVLPSALLVSVFAYFPAGSAMYHSFYRWNGHYINNFVGFGNFRRALGVPTYWVIALAVLVAVILFSKKRGPVAVGTKVVGGIVSMLVTLAVLAFTLPVVLEFLNALINCWNWRSVVSLYRCM